MPKATDLRIKTHVELFATVSFDLHKVVQSKHVDVKDLGELPALFIS
jgi:hypothetical protein